MAQYYCILFDADNTLLDFTAAENKALAETLTQYGVTPDAETMQKYREKNEGLWKKGRSNGKSCWPNGSAALWPRSACPAPVRKAQR